MLQKIRNAPPEKKFASTFFKLCIAVACTERKFLMDYINQQDCFEHNSSCHESLKLYLHQNFLTEEKNGLSFSQLLIIGDLILCGIRNYYCRPHNIIDAYRFKLKAQNVFEADIDKTLLKEERKQILRDRMEGLQLSVTNKMQNYVVG